MPMYEYYCSDCQDTFEALRPMSQADTEIACRLCESQKTARTLSLFAAHTKGQGNAFAGPSPASMAGGGGCCGGNCGCAH
ncbi:MAG: zinc ribbon domain-containing protein [Chloroflexota bacterium]